MKIKLSREPQWVEGAFEKPYAPSIPSLAALMNRGTQW
jgi:hypothetical protein